MKKKTVLITVFIVLLFSTLAMAWAWPAIAIGAGLRVVTTQGAKRVIVNAALSREAAKQAARLAVVENKTDLSWKVVSTAAGLMGIHVLLSDILGLKNKMEAEIPVQDDAIIAKYSDGSSCFLVETFDKIPGTQFNYTTKFHFVIDLSTRTGNVTLTHSRVDMTDQMVPRVRYQIGNGPEQTTTCIPDYEVTYTVINGDESEVSITYMGGRADEDIYAWIDNNPEAWLDPSLVTNTLTDTAPSNAQDMGSTSDVTIMDETEPDPSTGAVTDPRTGLDQSPVENPDDVSDTYQAPSQPSVPIFDTSMELPEKLSISERVVEFMNNAPFMHVIRNFEVTASSGSSTLSFSVFGRTYNWDFSQYEDHYNKMAVVLLALAYIWSAQIVFGGRA